MKDIFILGAGGHAKEICLLINDINKAQPSFNFKGFIDRLEKGRIKIGKSDFPVFNEDEFIKNSDPSAQCLAIGMGNPVIVEKLHKEFGGKFGFPNLIHPMCTGYWETIRLGEGNIITSGCIFTVDIHVASLNLFNMNTTVAHDISIGSYNVINPGANISGGVVIGDRNLIGANATILQNLKIGSDSILGAGAVLNKDLASNVTAVGVPAKTIKENKP